MAAALADQAPGRFGGQPAVALAAVPVAVLGAQHPLPALTIENAQFTDRGSEGARVVGPARARVPELGVTRLGARKGVQRHRASI